MASKNSKLHWRHHSSLLHGIWWSLEEFLAVPFEKRRHKVDLQLSQSLWETCVHERCTWSYKRKWFTVSRCTSCKAYSVKQQLRPSQFTECQVGCELLEPAHHPAGGQRWTPYAMWTRPTRADVHRFIKRQVEELKKEISDKLCLVTGDADAARQASAADAGGTPWNL